MDQRQQHDGKLAALVNPFLNVTDTNDVITGQVSGRRSDIADIITGGPSAILLVGAPSIGKSALIRYLQRSPEQRSWRDELKGLGTQLNLRDIHFAQIDLVALEGIEHSKEMMNKFIEQCTCALQYAYQIEERVSTDLRVLRELVRIIQREHEGFCFVMLDAIERLAPPDAQAFPFPTRARTPQELGLAVLEHAKVIRMLVDFIDDFSNFGIILAVASPPQPNIHEQFSQVSADLARFTTMTLQTFPWDEARDYLAQSIESFGPEWTKQFRELGIEYIFSPQEQAWLLEQAGTHPYLLQQFCFRAYQLKQRYAHINGTWADLENEGKRQLTGLISNRLNTFLAGMWKRIEEAIGKSGAETKSKFDYFIELLVAASPTEKQIKPKEWEVLGHELCYILVSEGAVRSDPFQPVHYPGAILRDYLVQKSHEKNSQISTQQAQAASTTAHGYQVTIAPPGKPGTPVSLSDLEYRLLKTLLRHPERCSEAELMQGAWGKTIDKPVFTQRIHHLRKKLREHSEGEEMIENRYGGIYLLSHPQWLHLI